MKKCIWTALALCIFAIGILASRPVAAPPSSGQVAVLGDPIMPLPLPPRPDPLS